MKVLVTGGAGFIGSHLVDALIKKGNKVVVIDDLSTGRKENLNKRAKFIKLDIADPKTSRIVDNEKPDAIFHLAAQALVTVSVKNPIRDAEVNIIGFLHLMEGAVKAKTKKVIFSSTGGAMYGDVELIPTPETIYARPLSPYGIAKLSQEHYLDYYREVHKLNSTILRYANVYGPRQNPFGEGGAVAIFTHKLLNHQSPTIYGHGKMTRDYIYVGDIVNANLAALKSKESGPFNISTGVELSTEKLFRKIQKTVGIDLEPEYADARPGEVARSCLDSRLAKKKLAWNSATTLDAGIEKTVQYLRSNL